MNEDVCAFACTVRELESNWRLVGCLARAKALQVEIREKLKTARRDARILKERIIGSHNDDAANAVLSLEETLSSWISEVEMWISFKDDRPGDAWDHMIDAQDHLGNAQRAHAISSDYLLDADRLIALECLLFPEPIFCSVAFSYTGSTCSICGEDYGRCDHVAGRAYMGRFCLERPNDLASIRHIALVSQPANKKCRAEKIKTGGIWRDCLTWQVVDADHDADDDSSAAQMQARILHAGDTYKGRIEIV